MKTEKQALAFFISQALVHAQGLPLRDAQTFLKGLLLITPDREETAPLHDFYLHLCSLNDELEALQLKLI